MFASTVYGPTPTSLTVTATAHPEPEGVLLLLLLLLQPDPTAYPDTAAICGPRCRTRWSVNCAEKKAPGADVEKGLTMLSRRMLLLSAS